MTKMFKKGITVLTIAMIFAGLLFVGTIKTVISAELPNIVLIVSDDQHWGDYGFMGHPTVKTPRIDRLAQEGLVYTRGYVPSSLCCPSLASLITGLYPHQHKITSNDPPLPKGKNYLSREYAGFYQTQEFADGRNVMIEQIKKIPTLPRILAEQGYLSLQTGKWWLGDYTNGGFTHGMTNGKRHGDAGLKIGRETMQPIIDFLNLAEQEKKPFFIWYAPMLPHQPHDPPERFLKHFQEKTDSIHQAKYWANIERFDETCGQLLDELDKRGLNEKTIVVYLSDNGWIQNQNAPAYAPKSKQSQYDGGLRTPLILRWTGHITPEKDNEHPVSSLDIVPTLLKLAGLEKNTLQPGLNLLDKNAIKERKAIYGECFTQNFIDFQKPEKSLRFRWIIEEDWKLIAAQPDEKTGIELYHLSDDPNETKNLTETQPQRVKALLTKLDAFYNPENP